MKVNDVMSRDVVCVRPDSNLQEAALKMRELNVGMLPVCEDDQRLVGTLTDRDITIRAVAEGHIPSEIQARDVMTPGVIYCHDDVDAREAAELMKEKQIRRLVVLDRQMRLIGIMSLGDLAVETGDHKLSGNALEEISEPIHPRH
jgi:CBS domain-containing protein